ncbi:hypothetical protein BD414DRAFT_220655, partial [Trametes punicea]
MRLIHTKTGRFHVFDDPRTIRYATLSHVWAREGERFYPEPTLQDVLRIQATQDALPPSRRVSIISLLPEKVRRFCQTAARYHYEYAWGDSFCIDKTSSSELSEAINSMFDWYQYSDVCYVYLHDVPPAATTAELSRDGSFFRESRWFKRGWTLQELLAPTSVLFFSEEWSVLGSKHMLAPLIEKITKIPQDVLTLERSLEEFSVACRMSWAVARDTTRTEDEAYSLMGIFGVKIQTTYGEGRYAFIRLQEEILKNVSDQTIFAWGLSHLDYQFTFERPQDDCLPSDMLQTQFDVRISSPYQYLFASSPKDFRYSSDLVSIPWNEALPERPTYTNTSYGIRTRLPLLTVRVDDPQMNAPPCIALLACKAEDQAHGERYLAIILRAQHTRARNLSDCFVGAAVGRLRDFMSSVDIVNSSMDLTLSHHYCRTIWLSKHQWEACRELGKLTDVYIPYRPPLAAYNVQREADLHSVLYSVPVKSNGKSDSFELRPSKWSEDLLNLHGYVLTFYRNKDSYVISIRGSAGASASELISIGVRRCDCHLGDREGFLSITVSDGRRAPSASSIPHKINDDSHVRSWSFKNGTASQDFLLRPNEARRITVRLSLTKSTESRQWTVYILGIEIWETHQGDVERARKRVRTMLLQGRGAGDLNRLLPESLPTTPTIHEGRMFPTPPVS